MTVGDIAWQWMKGMAVADTVQSSTVVSHCHPCCHLLSPTATHCHAFPHIATHGHPAATATLRNPPFVTLCRSLSLHPRHYSASTVTYFHTLSPPTGAHRRPLPCPPVSPAATTHTTRLVTNCVTTVGGVRVHSWTPVSGSFLLPQSLLLFILIPITVTVGHSG